jgi:hypothetical protein
VSSDATERAWATDLACKICYSTLISSIRTERSDLNLTMDIVKMPGSPPSRNCMASLQCFAGTNQCCRRPNPHPGSTASALGCGSGQDSIPQPTKSPASKHSRSSLASYSAVRSPFLVLDRRSNSQSSYSKPKFSTFVHVGRL